MKDLNDINLKDGDIIDIHQTVNGSNKFVILTINPLDVRYWYDLSRAYEYDKNDLLAPCKYTNESEFEIIGNIFN